MYTVSVSVLNVSAGTVDMHRGLPTSAIHDALTQENPQREKCNCGVYCNIV